MVNIKQLLAEAVRSDEDEGLEPLEAVVDRDQGILRMPNIGSYEPPGWDLICSYFVDKSGFGSEGEPALTIDQFFAEIKKGLAYAIVEEGQFQVYVGEFKRS